MSHDQNFKNLILDYPIQALRYLDFIDIYAHLDDNERIRYQREYPNEAEIMGTFSERFIQQGIEQVLGNTG